MSCVSVTVLGYEVLAINFTKTAPTEEEPPAMEAGSGHNFERDLAPPNPTGEEPWQDRKLGFR